jgi:hypothetical protein
VSLLTESDAFFTEHMRCGDRDAGVDGTAIWMACDCAATWPAAWTMMTARPTVELSIAEPIKGESDHVHPPRGASRDRTVVARRGA